jgi:hypothetical protein
MKIGKTFELLSTNSTEIAAKTLHFLISLRTDVLTEQIIAFMLEDCLLDLGLEFEFCSLHD